MRKSALLKVKGACVQALIKCCHYHHQSYPSTVLLSHYFLNKWSQLSWGYLEDKSKAKYISTRSYSGYALDNFWEDLSLVPWPMVCFFDDIDSQVQIFNSLFLDVLDQHAPIKRIKIKSRSNPFVTPDIKHLVKTRDRSSDKKWNENWSLLKKSM